MASIKEFEYLRMRLEDIISATNNFSSSNYIGKGGFGMVYKGELPHSEGITTVAVKRLDRAFGQGNPEFWKEIMMLSRCKHNNLISLLGFCDENNEKILVYEYAVRGSLDFHLSRADLTWSQRLKICIGAARGLEFLHNPQGTQQRVIHRDIKSSNILLDENWNAKISDFGLSKLGPANQQFTFLISTVAGTFGYCDPLYMETGFLTKESDVYSFGVVLFEVLCGRLYIGDHEDRRPLTGLVRESYVQNTLKEIVFDSLKDQLKMDSFKGFTKIAYRCLKIHREDRPTMVEILKQLELALEYQHAASFVDSQHSQSYQIVPFGAPKKALKVMLLHGILDIWVHEAKNLPNMEMFHKTVGAVFNRLSGSQTKITSDPFVSITISGAVIGRTYVINNSVNPVWKQHFNIPVAHHAAEVDFLVKDSDVVGSQLIGVVGIPVEHIYSGSKIEGFFPLINANGRPCKNGAGLGLTMQYIPISGFSLYDNGVGAGPQYLGIPGTYFPLRRGGRVTLYQDAHVPHGSLPDFKLDDGMHYVHGTCWIDIFDALSKAQRLIYITGWSVWHKVKLVREVPNAPEYTLGDLLKIKSEEGVRVLLLVWDDRTARNIMGYKTDGLMATHDAETQRFFKHSSVQLLLCPRMAGKRDSWVKNKEVGTIYTHHQKTVIVDADAGNGKRKIISFVGGLDLCDGRYDTPHHPIFRTLQTIHADDFHNPTFTGNLAGCPREPWHDLHSKIDGPAAYDVLTNFEERWLKAAKRGIKKLKIAYDDALLRIERIPEFVGVNDIPCLSDQDPEGWHVQIFRSIDSNSVKGFPEDPQEAKNLVCGKNVLIDMSIHSAYIKAIRSAQHYIYIENQYFIGSSYNWSLYKDVGADNLIPMEIALKIANKIKAHERFSVYIIVPMWPEGVPTGVATQRILFWQNKTMQMMYETIYKALLEVGLEEAFTPQDYLNFFCLGNREAVSPNESSQNETPGMGNTPQSLTRKNRRFMINVHSKGMIVDDEYVIIGSANINQRSMEGTRDTEIAMGAYQPHHTWARQQRSPRGQVYGYRMSLWAEHLGVVDECFTQPESLKCVRQIRSMSEANWNQFAADDITEMRAHLLKYPVDVDRKGKVRSLTGFETFPDVGGQIVGSYLGIQENLTT